MITEDNIPYEKVGNNEPVSIADEVPFEIPESWEWVRLINIYNFIDYRGKTPTKLSSGIPLVTAKNVKNGYVDYSIKDFISKDEFEMRQSRGISRKGDILFTTEAPMGNVALADLEIFSAGQRLITFQQYVNTELLSNELMMYFIMSVAFKEQLKANCTGTTVKGIKADKLKRFYMPVPPKNEQIRIVEVIKKLFPLINKYANSYTAVNNLNHSFPEQLKKSILQDAVMGKLVPQDENDEPASVLLDRIREEKQRLITEGKLKKNKHESIIYRRDNSHYEKIDGKELCIDDEIPFDIPSSWVWARTSSLGSMFRGKGIKRTETVAIGLPCVRYGEIYTSYDTSFVDTISYIDESLDKYCVHFSSGDVIFTLTGENKVDIAKAVAYFGESPVAAGGDMAYWTAHGINPLYIVFFMASPYCIEQKRRNATGDIIVHISTGKVGNFLIPIPPLKEQERIVEAVNEAFLKIEAL
ncbi:MAG: restriction endonuclease subunit S [Lachnospiraceae bacterium]|nr:restriction endonuclease subunit S [Lachnospiraceae bacterium]